MTGGDQMQLITSATHLTPSLHLHRSAAFSFFKPIFFMLHSTCFLYFILGRAGLRFPSGLCAIAFIKTSHSCRSKHDRTISFFIPFALASLSAACFNPNMSISSTLFLLSTNFTPLVNRVNKRPGNSVL